jgi:hypothetical protein
MAVPLHLTAHGADLRMGGPDLQTAVPLKGPPPTPAG